MVACILIIVATFEAVVAGCIKYYCSEKEPSSRRLGPEKARILFVRGLAFGADTHTNVARLLARIGRSR